MLKLLCFLAGTILSGFTILLAQESPCVDNCVVQNSVGTFVVAGAQSGDRFPPGCSPTGTAFCQAAVSGFQVVVVWLEPQGALTGSPLDLSRASAYLLAADGSRANLFSGGLLGGKHFVAFTPKLNAASLVLYFATSRPVDLSRFLGSATSPAISRDGVVNAASFRPGIAAGSWVTIQGSNLAAGTRTWRSDEIVNGKLPTQLDGVGVNINRKPAFVYYISPSQINVQAPSDETQGPVNVEVVNGGVTSTPAVAQLQAYSPGFFLWQAKYAVATRPDFSLVAKRDLFPGLPTLPAKPDDVIILWGTGFGPTNPPVPAGQVVTGAPLVVTNPSVRVGDLQAEIISAVLSPGYVGVYQVAIRIPAAAPSGDLPLIAEIGGVQSPGGVFITVER